jgi:hypothetical protein
MSIRFCGLAFVVGASPLPFTKARRRARSRYLARRRTRQVCVNAERERRLGCQRLGGLTYS